MYQLHFYTLATLDDKVKEVVRQYQFIRLVTRSSAGLDMHYLIEGKIEQLFEFVHLLGVVGVATLKINIVTHD